MPKSASLLLIILGKYSFKLLYKAIFALQLQQANKYTLQLYKSACTCGINTCLPAKEKCMIAATGY